LPSSGGGSSSNSSTLSSDRPMDRLLDMFDQRHELAGWALCALASYAILVPKLTVSWPAVALASLALITLLGSSRYAGVELGPVKLGSAAKRPPPETIAEQAAQRTARQVEARSGEGQA